MYPVLAADPGSKTTTALRFAYVSRPSSRFWRQNHYRLQICLCIPSWQQILVAEPLHTPDLPMYPVLAADPGSRTTTALRFAYVSNVLGETP
jgi:hypothetical protein